jgi:hydrogenase nickel incorporation protein HypA/HybF
MHEMAIAMALIEQVEKAAREQKARSIAVISVAVGRLSGVDPDALRAVFELAAEETLAAGAQLEVELLEGRELYIKSMDVDVEEPRDV